jgi:hypothetical protein
MNQNKKEGEESNKLLDFIKESPTVQAAIVEAVHRFYYDRVNSHTKQDAKDLEETYASDVLSTLWNLHPNWRYVLQKTANRYNSENTKAVSILGKPKNIKGIKVEIEII